jgi:hypothetical protein
MRRLKRLTWGNGAKKMTRPMATTAATLNRRMMMVTCDPFLEAVDGLVARVIASAGATGLAAPSTMSRS